MATGDIRPTVLQEVTLGPETVPGTAVATTKRLLANYVDPRPRIPTTPHRPTGSKMNQGYMAQKVHTDANLQGIMAFNDLIYLLSMTISKPTPPTWDFKLAPFVKQAIKTFTFEVGGDKVDKWAYGFGGGIEFECTQRECTNRGSIFGRKMTPGATPSGSITDVKKSLIDPTMVDVFLDTIPAPAVLLSTCTEVRFAARNLRSPAFGFDTTQQSYRGDVERAGEWSAQITVEQDSVADGLLDHVVNKDLLYLKVLCTGPEFSVGNPYRFSAILPVMFQEPDPRADREGVYSGVYNLLPVYDIPSAGIGSAAAFHIDSDVTTW